MSPSFARKPLGITTQTPRRREHPDLAVVVPQAKNRANYYHPKHHGHTKAIPATSFQSHTSNINNESQTAASSISDLTGAFQDLNPFTDAELSFIAEHNLDKGQPPVIQQPQNDSAVIDCNYFGYFHQPANVKIQDHPSEPFFKTPLYLENPVNDREHFIESPCGTRYSEAVVSSLTAEEAFELYAEGRRGMVRHVERQSLGAEIGAGLSLTYFDEFWKLVHEDEAELVELEAWRRRKGGKG